MKLAVAFHGRTNSNEMVRDYMQLGWGSYGYKQNDFIVAYPAGMWAGPYSWSQYENIEFFDAIITQVSEQLCVDRNAVFSVGHSLGSYMSNKVSCQRGDVIRAMAGVASDGFRGDCTGPVASLIAHLPGDPLAGYSGGERAYSIRSEVNLCSAWEQETTQWDIKSCTEKTSCTPWNTAMFCNAYSTYGNDQHSWPKQGSDDILDFFRDIDEYK
jgi:polyhydroxybutyrate depolymerase